MIVSDTNLVVYLTVEGEHSDTARSIREADADWVVPTWWRAEFLNVLATFMRRGLLTHVAALRVWGTAEILVGDTERHVNAEAILAVAAQYRISAYDAHFVALAQHLGLTLVTGDLRLARACPTIAVHMKEFARQ